MNERCSAARPSSLPVNFSIKGAKLATTASSTTDRNTWNLRGHSLPLQRIRRRSSRRSSSRWSANCSVSSTSSWIWRRVCQIWTILRLSPAACMSPCTVVRATRWLESWLRPSAMIASSHMQIWCFPYRRWHWLRFCSRPSGTNTSLL